MYKKTMWLYCLECVVGDSHPGPSGQSLSAGGPRTKFPFGKELTYSCLTLRSVSSVQEEEEEEVTYRQ